MVRHEAASRRERLGGDGRIQVGWLSGRHRQIPRVGDGVATSNGEEPLAGEVADRELEDSNQPVWGGKHRLRSGRRCRIRGDKVVGKRRRCPARSLLHSLVAQDHVVDERSNVPPVAWRRQLELIGPHPDKHRGEHVLGSPVELEGRQPGVGIGVTHGGSFAIPRRPVTERGQ